MASKQISIHDEMFDVTAPYAEGAVLSAADAKVLNQTRAENIANNFRKQIKDAKEKGESLDTVRSAFAEYDAKYNFSMGGGPRAPSMDPVEREARAIVKRAIVAQAREKGKSLKDLNPEKVEANIEANWQNDGVLKLARKTVKDRSQKLVETNVDELV